MTLEATFWDVQHGSAAFIRTPNGRSIAIDLGTGSYSGNNAVFSPLLHLKTKYQIDSLDYVVITHPHTDHIDDIDNFNKLSPRILRRPRHLSPDDIKAGNPKQDQNKVEKYIEIDNRFTSPVVEETNSVLPQNNGGVKFTFFSPTKCNKSNLNNHSIITIVEYCGHKIIIPGDNESESWDELLGKPGFIDAIRNTDIFVASHHGRESGYHPELFNYFKPRLTIVSDGAETDTSAVNRYTKISTGWEVYKRSGGSINRNCLTTRNDGPIVVKLGNNFINVTID